jgi:hypothetical protein
MLNDNKRTIKDYNNAAQRYNQFMWRCKKAERENISKCSKAFQIIQKKMISKWSIKDGNKLFLFPPWMLKKVYSAIDAVRINGRTKPKKGRVVYYYIPEEWTKDGHPIIVDVEVELNCEPPEGACVMSFRAMKDVFIHNKFQN